MSIVSAASAAFDICDEDDMDELVEEVVEEALEERLLAVDSPELPQATRKTEATVMAAIRALNRLMD